MEVDWLPGAGHTAWVSDWPPAIRRECEEIMGALRPLCSVEIYVSNLDYASRLIDATRFREQLRQEITRTTGGQTLYRTEGEFKPAGEIGMNEETLVIKTFMPTVINDALRLWLVHLLVNFGVTAAQAVVQVEIASHAYWIPTKLLLGLFSTATPPAPTHVFRRQAGQ